MVLDQGIKNFNIPGFNLQESASDRLHILYVIRSPGTFKAHYVDIICSEMKGQKQTKARRTTMAPLLRRMHKPLVKPSSARRRGMYVAS